MRAKRASLVRSERENFKKYAQKYGNNDEMGIKTNNHRAQMLSLFGAPFILAPLQNTSAATTLLDSKYIHICFLFIQAFIPYGDSKNRVFSHPDMLKQYASCLARRVVEMDELEIKHPQISFDVWKSMNGRYQQRMVRHFHFELI